jgi:hypothetical protein
MVGELLRQSIVSTTKTTLPSGKGVQQRHGAPRNDDVGRERRRRDGISSCDCVLSGHVGERKGRGTGRRWYHWSEVNAAVESRMDRYRLFKLLWIGFFIDIPSCRYLHRRSNEVIDTTYLVQRQNKK